MTNEEAVKMLRTMQRTVYLGNRKFEDAIECAIKALSEPLQPWEVLVAQAVLPHPEPHWIPVTENCDCDLMDNEEVLVFQKDGTINGQIRHAMFYDFNGKKKFVTWEEGITIYNVLAYMPLPEPYKGSDK